MPYADIECHRLCAGRPCEFQGLPLSIKFPTAPPSLPREQLDSAASTVSDPETAPAKIPNQSKNEHERGCANSTGRQETRDGERTREKWVRAVHVHSQRFCHRSLRCQLGEKVERIVTSFMSHVHSTARRGCTCVRRRTATSSGSETHKESPLIPTPSELISYVSELAHRLNQKCGSVSNRRHEVLCTESVFSAVPTHTTSDPAKCVEGFLSLLCYLVSIANIGIVWVYRRLLCVSLERDQTVKTLR